MGRGATRAALLGGVLVAVVAAATALAASAGPEKGARYSGFATPAASGITIKWKVSSSGKKVTGLKINRVPAFCDSGAETVSATFKSASIKNARFSSTAAANFESGPNAGQPQYRLKLKARFTKAKKATGTISTDWLGDDKSCDGESTFFAQPR